MPDPPPDPDAKQDSEGSDDSVVYVRTDAGHDEIRSRAAGLAVAARSILLMVDGHRTVAALQPLIAGSNAPPDVLATLAGRGFIELRGGATEGLTAAALDAPQATIDWWDVAPEAMNATDAATAADADGATAAANRYEHLYTMMNDIVRDFLAPHRRYLFQLRIERCSTADELVELLHGLQTVLAKARGESFASDVIARLRIAAG